MTFHLLYYIGFFKELFFDERDIHPTGQADRFPFGVFMRDEL